MVELTEAMTSMGVSGGQTVLSSNTYQRVAHCLQDLAPFQPQQVWLCMLSFWSEQLNIVHL